MSPRTIPSVLTVLIPALALACRLFSATFETPAPQITATAEPALVQIGYFDSLYLMYDPEVWDVMDETQGQQSNPKGEPIQALRHRTIPGCFLQDNLGRGAPPTWELQVADRMIGPLEYSVEAWTDTEAKRQVLIVYQYPAGEAAAGKRIELVLDQDPEECVRSAEDVLVDSADLISKQQ